MSLQKNLVFNSSLPLGELAIKLYKKVETTEQLIEVAFYFLLLNELVVNADFRKYSLIYFKNIYKEATGLDFDKIIIRA